MDGLSGRLAEARKRLASAQRALTGRGKGGEWEEYEQALAAALRLERILAATKGEEFAVPIEFPVRWDIGAPLPHLLMNDARCLLIFHESMPPDPARDGSAIPVVSAADKTPAALALVEFRGCVSAKLGAPNDEVFGGHPLNGRGLEPYTAQVVMNSRWLKELEAINSVHRGYQPARWQDCAHYVMWFHDKTFECAAFSFAVERHTSSLPDLLALACQRLTA